MSDRHCIGEPEMIIRVRRTGRAGPYLGETPLERKYRLGIADGRVMTDRHCIGEPGEDLWPWRYSLVAVLLLGIGCWASIWLAIELLLWVIQ